MVEPGLKPRPPSSQVYALSVQSEHSQMGAERSSGGYMRADLLKAAQLSGITSLD